MFWACHHKEEKHLLRESKMPPLLGTTVDNAVSRVMLQLVLNNAFGELQMQEDLHNFN
jgi:hypothetical protein